MIRRALLGWIALVLLVSTPSFARAQDVDKPKRPPPPRPIQTTPPPPDVKPAAKPDATYLALPAPLVPGAAFTNGGFGSGGFTNGGLRSNLPVVDNAAPTCRATCAKSRYVCLSNDDPVLCDPQWTQCLAACGR